MVCQATIGVGKKCVRGDLNVSHAAVVMAGDSLSRGPSVTRMTGARSSEAGRAVALGDCRDDQDLHRLGLGRQEVDREGG